MQGRDISRAAGSALWRAVFRPESLSVPAPAGLDAAAARLVELVSAPLADFFLARAAERLGAPLVERDLVERGKLQARFARAAQLECLRALDAAGIETVCFKGFAHAYLLYPDPDLRTFGDLDLLVRPADLGRVIELLAARGFTFRPETAQRWGFQAEGSFVPFASADDSCNLDLHTEPDVPPIGRALDAGLVFARARAFAAGTLALKAPSAEHMVVLGLSNAAKDRLGPYAVRKLLDLVRLVALEPGLDWHEIESLVSRAGLAGPARAVFALLERLGAELSGVPRSLRRPPGWPAQGEFERLVADYETMLAGEAGALAVLRREFLITAGAAVALRRNGRRFSGLVRPRSGLPPGVSARGLPTRPSQA
ncbi:MAG TPA: nucleotidyltransferase family protein [Alphaproteobacteria bacterium]|nr:nucleotidyltransferase family protein [Alphaproteobacteria bacterium]